MIDSPEKIYYLCFAVAVCGILVMCVRNRLAKIFSLAASAFLFIFCGIGYLFFDVPANYIIYWMIYLFAFLFPFLWMKKKKTLYNENPAYQHFLDQFLAHTSTYVIVIYLGLILSGVILEGKFTHLFLPPAPDVFSQFRARMYMEQGGMLSLLARNSAALLYPFYLLALYKYRSRIYLLVLLYILPVYMEYCRNSYLGRCAILGHLAVVFGMVYVFKTQWRKLLLLSLPLCALFGIIFSAFYFNLRSDNEVSIFDSILSEIGLCSGFENCVDFYSDELKSNYLLYVLNLPLPGSLKFYHADSNFSVLFSELHLGLDRTDPGFYVFLPGAVNEGIFLLGTSCFWLHGLISGFFFLLCVRFCHTPHKILLYLYVLFIIGSFFARGGCVSSYPFILKQFLFMEIVLGCLYVSFNNPAGEKVNEQ